MFLGPLFPMGNLSRRLGGVFKGIGTKIPGELLVPVF